MDSIYTRLTPGHTIKPFDCNDKDLNEFLTDDAINYNNALMAVTYLLEGEDKTFAYFSLLNDKISKTDFSCSNWKRAKKHLAHSKHRSDYPAVKIGRLAVHKDLQRNPTVHIGKAIIDNIKLSMLDHNKTGCRYITVDAYYQSVEFYQHCNFDFMNLATMQDYLKAKAEIDKIKEQAKAKGIPPVYKWPEKTLAMYFDLSTL